MGRGVFREPEAIRNVGSGPHWELCRGFQVGKIVKKIILDVPLSIDLKARSWPRNIRSSELAELESFQITGLYKLFSYSVNQFDFYLGALHYFMSNAQCTQQQLK